MRTPCTPSARRPRCCATILAARAGYLAAVGGLLAVPAGLLPAAAMAPLANVPLTFSMPWPRVRPPPRTSSGRTSPARPERENRGRAGSGASRFPEKHADPEGASLQIAFVVYESSNPEPGPPIFNLIGGPGAPGVDYTAEEALNPLLPLDEPLTHDAIIEAQSDAMRRCSDYWTRRGVDLAAYNSVASADDADAVRRACRASSRSSLSSSRAVHGSRRACRTS